VAARHTWATTTGVASPPEDGEGQPDVIEREEDPDGQAQYGSWNVARTPDPMPGQRWAAGTRVHGGSSVRGRESHVTDPFTKQRMANPT